MASASSASRCMLVAVASWLFAASTASARACAAAAPSCTCCARLAAFSRSTLSSASRTIVSKGARSPGAFAQVAGKAAVSDSSKSRPCRTGWRALQWASPWQPSLMALRSTSMALSNASLASTTCTCAASPLRCASCFSATAAFAAESASVVTAKATLRVSTMRVASPNCACASTADDSSVPFKPWMPSTWACRASRPAWC
mmetsp:Transcript_92581/g.288075  ORF Transcript_92581/g.288075 Transcript_92581/m.288075 type:complete len:201 (-) Transcript_92581:319-921(-)